MNKESKIFGFIVITSLLIIGFLFWLIYFKTASVHSLSWVGELPALNAFLNALTATFLITGYRFIKKGEKEKHKILMLLATFSSALFLCSYITYHHFHGDTKFIATGSIRIMYFGILISHILLSIVQVPLILITLYLAFAEKFVRHRTFARITFPIWLYVSVTGVLIFVFLKWFNK